MRSKGKSRWRGSRGFNPHQLQLDWTVTPATRPVDASQSQDSLPSMPSEATDHMESAVASEMAKSKKPRNAKSDRITARLPVPRPLPSCIAAGHFGYEENGKPVHPGSREVREITDQHAETLIELLDSIASGPQDSREGLQLTFDTGIAAYAEDFGHRAAQQLKAYVRRQAGLDAGQRRGR